MRILLLTQWFTPEPTLAYQEMAVELAKMGHEVTVVTGFPNWPSGKLYPGYKQKLWQRETISGVSIVRLPIYPNHGRGRIKRILNLTSLAFSFAILAPWLVRRPDRIHVIQLPSLALAARAVGFLWRTPFTFDIQDMWPETLKATGMMTRPTTLAIISRVCRGVYRKASKIRVISPGFKRNLIEKGVSPDKIEVISNWTDTETYRPISGDALKARELGLTGKFNVLYAGTMGLAQNLTTVLQAADRLKDLPEIQFVLAGYGVEEKMLRAESERLGQQNVLFIGSFPYEEMSSLFALVDVLLIHLRDDPLFEITIPGKTLTYLAVGKPIIAALAGDAAEVIVETESGLTCKSDDPGALASTVKTLYEMPSSEREAMGARGRQAAVQAYGKVSLVGRLEKLIVG